VTLAPMRVLGLMSGTSCDGVDGVLARFAPAGERLAWEVLERRSLAYPDGLRDRLLQALKPETSDVALITQLNAELGEVYAELAGSFDGAELIALSGQTVYHIPRRDPSRGWYTVSTLQLGEAAVVAERCRVPVYANFRQSDMAAGGQGAPLVAFGDLKLYWEPGVTRAVHNLGGISNLTYLPAGGDPDSVFAFDTGPANCLIDEAMERHFGLSYDENGRVAARGRVDEDALARLMRHPYLALPPPKTTGREVFTLTAFERELAGLEPHDLVATLTAFTAASMAEAYRKHVLPRGCDEVLLAGGGALNPTLVAMIRERLRCEVATFEERGWVAKDREALAFAVMGYYAAHGLPNTLPRATGARRAVVAGMLARP
jgi:anhydro-N-acetylmuramic acid kinase